MSLVDANNRLITSKKIKFGEFEFDVQTIETNPIYTMMLLISADPTEKQKELLKLMQVTILDSNGKRFFPQEEPTEKNKTQTA